MPEPWFKAAFGEHYTHLYAHRNDVEARKHLPHIEALARLKGASGPILDCGCGTGRYTRLLRDRGYTVHGLDYSQELLAMATKEDGGAGRWVRGNMLELPFEMAFSRVLSLFTSFGYFESDQENLQALGGMVRCLQPGGMLYLDFLNAEKVEGSDWEERVSGDLTMRSRKTVMPEREAVVKDVEIRREADLITSYRERVKLYGLDWFKQAFRECGAEILEVFGDESGGSYEENSTRLILLARRISS